MSVQSLCALLEQQRERIMESKHFLWAHPETGYREWKTHEYLAKAFSSLGCTLTSAGSIPGFYTDIDTGRPGPTLLVLAEMDALKCATHPDADPETQAVHACGHFAQSAALLGIAAVLTQDGALDGLCGKIRLMEVPAEEALELEYREELRRNGVIRYYGGKQEFIARGYLDDADLAILIHASNRPAGFASVSGASNGFMIKSVTFTGHAAHAASSPHLGVNALYAANLALNAINALRETFRDEDHIRCHPIITEGGAAVNAIPDTVKLENLLRGASVEAITRENIKINRAVAGAALAMGADAVFCDRPGYLPRKPDPTLCLIARDAALACLGEGNVRYPGPFGTASSDIGDVMSLIPTAYLHVGGAVGTGHGNDYYVPDKGGFCMNSAKIQLTMISMLLEHDAALAKQVMASYQPTFSDRQAYLDAMEQMTFDGHAISYHENHPATVRWHGGN